MNYHNLPPNQVYFVIIAGLSLLFIVIELVRRRKMLEQYSILWIVIGVCAATFLWLYPLIQKLTVLIGAGYTTSTILFGAIFILLLIVLQLCVKLTEFSHNIKDLVQEISLLSDEIDTLRKKYESVAPPVSNSKSK
jgi:hypothetical protein